MPGLPFSVLYISACKAKQNPSGFPFAQVEDINIFVGYEIYLNVLRVQKEAQLYCIACSVVKYSMKKKEKIMFT